ncbi:MAG: hypothetical protein ACRD1Z_03545 [Vicinamibacteria bacterium]
MRKVGWFALAMLLSVPALSTAQIDDDLRQQRYVFAAPGAIVAEGTATTLELGGGMQWLVYRGLGLGFDASLMGFAECFSCRMALGSFDASYHFVPSSGHLVPFVLGGVGGVVFADGGGALGSVGGGINYWFENGMALRLEVRDRFRGEGVHILGVRVGITF